MYKLTLQRDYLKHWTVEDAVREIIQNAIDHDENGQVNYYMSGKKLRIATDNVKLHPSVLLLGAGDKSEDEDKLGGFGEGMKVAMLILVREGIEVIIENYDKIWIPKFVYDETYQQEMLCIEETENPNPPRGLVYHMKGFSITELQNIRKRTLQMQSEVNCKETSHGEVLLDEEFKGMVYVGGLYVCNISDNMEYGYNFKKGLVPLNRDRQTIPDFDIKYNAVQMLSKVVSPEELIDLVTKEREDVAYYKYAVHNAEASNLAHKGFVEQYGSVAVARNEEDADKLRTMGYETRVVNNENLYNMISQADTYSLDNVEKGETLQDFLQEEIDKFEGEDIMIEAKYYVDVLKKVLGDDCARF